jgi:hypothetical protein
MDQGLPEDERVKLLLDVGTHMSDYTMLQPMRPWCFNAFE